MTNLLSKSFKSFLTYTAIVLACSIPAYFLIVDWIWQHELKEHNIIVATGIKHHLKSLQINDSALQESLVLWNKLQPERQIAKAKALQPDSTYNVYRYNTLVERKGKDRFQGLVSYFEINGRPYCINVETNMEESYETILGLTIVAVIFFIFLLGGLTIINRKLSGRIWKPFYQSLTLINNFDLNRQQQIVFPKSDTFEFEELNKGLSKLIEGNLAAYQQQKHFIENAAHELQTPLAVIQAKLDVFLQDESLSDKQSYNVEHAQYAVSRANKINKNLLLLARIENSQFPRTEDINLSEMLEDNLTLLDSFIAERRIQVLKEIDIQSNVRANKMLVEILISNLLLNAVRYSPDQSVLQIKVSDNSFSIINSGTASLNKEHLFKRFGRVSSEAPTTGLGLAIVKQIAQQYMWTVDYEFVNQQHRFTVSFATLVLQNQHL